MFEVIGGGLLIGLLILSAAFSILAVGQPREPLTSGGAVVAVALDLLLIAIVLALLQPWI